MHEIIGQITADKGGDINQGSNALVEFCKIASAFVAGYFVNWLQTRRDRINRKRDAIDEFRRAVGGQIAKLELIESTAYEPRFFQDSKPVIGDAVHKVRPVLDSVEWARLDALWEQYRDQAYNEDAQQQLAGEFSGKPNQRERLKSVLERIRQSVE